MNRIFVSFFNIPIFTYSQTTQYTTEVIPYEVMLYNKGAKFKAKYTIFLLKGRNTDVVNYLPNCIDENSFRIGLGDFANLFSFTITNKEAKTNLVSLYHSNIQTYIDCVNQIFEIKNRILINQKNHASSRIQKIVDVISYNRNLNQINSGKDNSYPFSYNLTTLINTYEQKLITLSKETESFDDQIYKILQNRAFFNQNISPTYSSKPLVEKLDLHTKNLFLYIQLNETKNSPIDLSYFVNQTSWISLNDFKLNKLTDSMLLVYKSNIYQHTKQDWNNVKCTVSAYIPCLSTQRLEMSSLFINFVEIVRPFEIENSKTPEVFNSKNKIVSNYAQKALESNMSVGGYSENENTNLVRGRKVEVIKDILTAQISQLQLNVEYQVANLQIILSSKVPSNEILAKQSSSSENKYYHIPKLSKDVFLMEWLKNWNHFNFLDREASKYLNDNYVGKTWVSTKYVGDNFPISFGVDDRITTKRLTIKDKSEDNVKKNLKTLEILFEKSIRNNTLSDIDIDVYDLRPVSEDQLIKIENIKTSNAEYTSENGKVYCNLKIPKFQTKTKRIGYKISYPKDGYLQYQNR